MSDTLDTGSGWKEKDELTPDEERRVKELMDAQQKWQSEFTFWLREHRATPKKVELKIQIGLTGQCAEDFMWLNFFLLKPGWEEKNVLLGKIVRAGVKCIFEQAQMGQQAALMRRSLLQSLPGDVAQEMTVAQLRASLSRWDEIQKKKDEDMLKGLADGSAGDSNKEKPSPDV